ncbi:MAG: sigma-70 family RNA polymerase sigma factor [Saprospiraceae bacterium]|nr:sigma-70 family RNA polymerase sigma factor [Saprospiraceae bacterium]MCB9324242.1 sigma-70 family RNA polymerase sigma factor [Lewinellaceae bacterium]
MEVVAKTNLSKKALEDYELVKKATNGDQMAYSILMDRYRNSIYHLMLKMSGDSEDSHDLTIEAFGKAFIKLPSYVPRYAFSTWLYRIAINNCIDHVRKKRFNIISIDETLFEDTDLTFSTNMEAYCLNPEDEIIREQRLFLIRKLVNQLNKKYRLMIELRFFEELSYEEIAQELSIPLGTVKAQLFRAKEILFELIQQPGASAHFDATYVKAAV